jgi:hypothetical protein
MVLHALWWCLRKLVDVLAAKLLPFVWKLLKKQLPTREPGIISYYRNPA